MPELITSRLVALRRARGGVRRIGRRARRQIINGIGGALRENRAE